MELRRIRGLFAASLCCLAANAIAAPLPQCAAVDPRTLPDTASCQRQFAAIEPAALYERADAHIKAGQFGLAVKALDCAAAHIADDSDPRALRMDSTAGRAVLSRRGSGLGAYAFRLRVESRRNTGATIASPNPAWSMNTGGENDIKVSLSGPSSGGPAQCNAPGGYCFTAVFERQCTKESVNSETGRDI